MNSQDMIFWGALIVAVWAASGLSKHYWTRKYRYAIYGVIYVAAMIVVLILVKNKI